MVMSNRLMHFSDVGILHSTTPFSKYLDRSGKHINVKKLGSACAEQSYLAIRQMKERMLAAQ